jgi:hypothetical protein
MVNELFLIICLFWNRYTSFFCDILSLSLNDNHSHTEILFLQNDDTLFVQLETKKRLVDVFIFAMNIISNGL